MRTNFLSLPEAFCNPLATEFMAGGSTCQVQKLFFADGQNIVVKSLEQDCAGFFAAEALSLKILADTKCVQTPRVLAQNDSCICLEYIRPSEVKPPVFWEQLGLKIAEMHQIENSQFGFSENNFLGKTHQKNTWKNDSFAFYTENRFQVLGKRLFDEGLLKSQWLMALERFCLRLPQLIPQQPASLLHGDLWLNNVICADFGTPYLIDPACYYGWAEADLAMTKMFGGFSPAFLDAYEDVRPLNSGFEERINYYNLYHWLNHLYLFGESYLGQVQAILRPF